MSKARGRCSLERRAELRSKEFCRATRGMTRVAAEILYNMEQWPAERPYQVDQEFRECAELAKKVVDRLSQI